MKRIPFGGLKLSGVLGFHADLKSDNEENPLRGIETIRPSLQ